MSVPAEVNVDRWHEEQGGARHEIEECMISRNTPYKYMDSAGINFSVGTTEPSRICPFKIDHLLDKCALTQYLGLLLNQKDYINHLGLTAPESSTEKGVGFP